MIAIKFPKVLFLLLKLAKLQKTGLVNIHNWYIILIRHMILAHFSGEMNTTF